MKNSRFVVCCCQSHEESFLFLAFIPRIELKFNFSVMGVVEKSDGAEVAVEAEIEWGLVDNEIQLLQTLCQTSRPIGKLCKLDKYWQMLWLQSWSTTGISKYFQMACIVEKLASNLNKEVTSKGVWDHLSTMYNLQKLVSPKILWEMKLYIQYNCLFCNRKSRNPFPSLMKRQTLLFPMKNLVN